MYFTNKMKRKRDSWSVSTLIALGVIFQSACTTGASTAAATTNATASISCYACGQSQIDPNLDLPGSFCDLDLNSDCPDGTKTYNSTCDIMDRLGASDHWVRQCPKGVKSCFVAQGTYLDQSPKFRGCAGAIYPYDEGCTLSLQAVTVVDGKTSVDVQVNLCYCNGDNCNEQLKGGADRVFKVALATLLLPAILTRILA